MAATYLHCLNFLPSLSLPSVTQPPPLDPSSYQQHHVPRSASVSTSNISTTANNNNTNTNTSTKLPPLKTPSDLQPQHGGLATVALPTSGASTSSIPTLTSNASVSSLSSSTTTTITTNTTSIQMATSAAATGNLLSQQQQQQQQQQQSQASFANKYPPLKLPTSSTTTAHHHHLNQQQQQQQLYQQQHQHQQQQQQQHQQPLSASTHHYLPPVAVNAAVASNASMSVPSSVHSNQTSTTIAANGNNGTANSSSSTAPSVDPAALLNFETYEDVFESVETEEYAQEIMEFMKEMELKTLPSNSYMDHQKEITWKLRKTLVIWLIEIHTEYDLRPETLFLSINLLDRVCSKRSMTKHDYQLLGITSLWVASKYEENHGRVPSLKNLIYISCNVFTEKDFIAMEQMILSDLSFDLGHPTAEAFLRVHVKSLGGVSTRSRAIARYILEMTLLHRRFLGYRPSMLATASLMLADVISGTRYWTHSDPLLAKILGYMEEVLGHPPKQVAAKYAGEKFLGASEIVKGYIANR
ncbi:G2/mitotic-specific cyclin [Chytridiales sp. JEL 0842]|nr:G2/mitotic-specific cyclin [Chytridiales sp. JEL 0842]